MYLIVWCLVCVGVDCVIVVCLMMNVVLMYDYCFVDGREVVIFLKSIKEFVEDLRRMMFEV